VLNFFGKRLRYMQEVPREERGFTLIELLIVIIIIGILAAIAIPVFLSQRVKAQQAASKSDTRNAGTAQVMWYAANDTFTDNLADLQAQGFRQSQGVVTTIDAAVTDASNYCVESDYVGAPAGAPVATTDYKMTDDSGGVIQGSCP
jgi:prepilin-type N-terminal cleavage/methylation domain-containing protein